MSSIRRGNVVGHAERYEEPERRSQKRRQHLSTSLSLKV